MAPPDEPDLPSEEPVEEYDDTGAPVAERPAPAAHLSVLPLKDDYIASVLRDMPGMKDLDPRVLRLVTGDASTARDVSGVDAATGTYHASPNQTPYGITKNLTGKVERVQELLAANPQKSADSSPIWNIPPGWLQYARGETGAPLTTSRKYVVQSGDFPRAIAEKLGAVDRNWWSELRSANPHKPLNKEKNNWKSLTPGEELGVPDAWPPSNAAQPVNGATAPVASTNTPSAPSANTPAPVPSTNTPAPAPTPTPGLDTAPGLPGPGKNTTMDPGLIGNVQFMLAHWSVRYGEANPRDYGMLYNNSALDITNSWNPRTKMALQSFQFWWNRRWPTRMLRLDGELDEPTYRALYEVEVMGLQQQQLPPPAQQPPPPPIPQQPAPQQQSTPAPSPQLPGGFQFPGGLGFPTQPPAAPQPQPQPSPSGQGSAPAPQPSPSGQGSPTPSGPQFPAGFPFPAGFQLPNFPGLPGFGQPSQSSTAPPAQPSQPSTAPPAQGGPQSPFPLPGGIQLPPWLQSILLPQQAPQAQFRDTAGVNDSFPLDQALTESQKEAVRQVLATEADPMRLDVLAVQMEQCNLPLCAQALRYRSASLWGDRMQVDGHMSTNDQQAVRAIMRSELERFKLEVMAYHCGRNGFPVTGSWFRSRAYILLMVRTTLDHHMPAETQQAVRQQLLGTPDYLDAAGKYYQSYGFPIAAAAFLARANEVRWLESQYKAGQPQQQSQPQPWPSTPQQPQPQPWPNAPQQPQQPPPWGGTPQQPQPWPPDMPNLPDGPPVVVWDNNPSHAAQTNEPSLLPIIALIGAGFVFS
ncbi:hypothetical protein [Polyangium sp. 6x1]|uniref:hypothetical protein n=1 Tax=Polyangium sp. 6x1 TaxID=3042689 RepID=UPI0024828A6C|nr:hypothetical protein [Polyangium sp. 6x1]MDI1444705.1 hypothetical protein [Polyangium sp. 6x1]